MSGYMSSRLLSGHGVIAIPVRSPKNKCVVEELIPVSLAGSEVSAGVLSTSRLKGGN